MTDYFIRNPDSLRNQPKRVVGDYVEANGIKVPWRTKSLTEARAYPAKIIARSESLQDYDGIANLFHSPILDMRYKIYENLKKALSKGKIFGSEGLAINISVYVDKVPVEFLPLNCNWIASNLLPKYNNDKKIFVEPNLPNYQIGIMHLAAGIWVDKMDMRINKNLKIQLETLSGEKVFKSLRYQS